MTGVFTYHGQAPQGMQGEVNERVLDILEAQLEVLKNMTRQVFIVPAGTRLTKEDVEK